MKRYPFEFHQLDWREALERFGHTVDAVHASPPCQAYSATQRLPNVRDDHPQLLEPVREALIKLGKPYVIENVIGAPMHMPIVLCGLSFKLKVFRHRLFESNVFLFCPPHVPHGDRRIGVDGYVCVAGNGGGTTSTKRKSCPADHRNKESWSSAMQIDWMSRDELAQAIPPAYTKYIGGQLVNYIGQKEFA